MKCPTCGAWSLVRETRTEKEGIRRRRECANSHIFYTQEVIVPTRPRGGNRHGAAFKERQKVPSPQQMELEL